MGLRSEFEVYSIDDSESQKLWKCVLWLMCGALID